MDGHWLRIGLARPVFRRFRCVFIAFLDFRMQAGVVACRIHDDCIAPNARSTLHGRSGSARADGVLAPCFRPTSACRHCARRVDTDQGRFAEVRAATLSRCWSGLGHATGGMRLFPCSARPVLALSRTQVEAITEKERSRAPFPLWRPLALPRRVECRRLARPCDYRASRDWLLSVCL